MAVGVFLVEADDDGLLAEAADRDDDLPGVARFEALPAGGLGDRADELLGIGRRGGAAARRGRRSPCRPPALPPAAAGAWQLAPGGWN